MIVEGRVMIGKLPETLDGHVEALEMKAKKVAPGARNIFNSTPPLQEATPAMYEGSGRSMIESPTPHDRENEILREILWQVEARSPSQTEMEDVRPQAEHIVSVGDPTFVLTAKDQVCQWQVPHRDGIDDKAAAVLVALSPDGANFLFWGPVRQQERPRRTEAKMVHIFFGEFVFFLIDKSIVEGPTLDSMLDCTGHFKLPAPRKELVKRYPYLWLPLPILRSLSTTQA